MKSPGRTPKSSRRPKGLGSVYPYGDGYRGYVTIAGRRIYRFGTRMKEVEDALLAARLEYKETGRPPEQTRGRSKRSATHAAMNFEAFAENWIQRHSIRIRPSTEIEYRRLLTNHINPVIGAIPLTSIRFSDVDDVIVCGLRKGLARGTLAHLKTLMNLVMKAAWNEGLITDNPVPRVELPPAPASKVEAMPLEAIEPILAAAKQRSWSEYARRYIAMHYGLRRGEIVALTWRDLNRETKELSIEHSITRDFTGEVIGETKTPKGRRTLMIGDELIEILDEVQKEQETARLRFLSKGGRRFNPDGLIFTTRTGKKITKGSDLRSWDLTRKAAGYPNVRLHDARHMVASEMVAHGTDIASVSGLLGHADSGFTLRRYVHRSAGDAGDAGAVIAHRAGRDRSPGS